MKPIFAPGVAVWIKGIPHDFRRIDRAGHVLGRVPYEPDLYRIKTLDGSGVEIVSGSMLNERSEVTP